MKKRFFAVALATTMTLSSVMTAMATDVTTTVDTETGLIGYYTFEDTLVNIVSENGTAKLHGGAGGDTWNNATTGTATYADGVNGKGYVFSGDTSAGSGEGLELDVKTGKEFTIGMWVNTKEKKNFQPILFSAVDFDNYIVAGTMYNDFASGGIVNHKKGWIWLDKNAKNCVAKVTDLLLNTWTYVTMTMKTDGTVAMYYDGELLAEEKIDGYTEGHYADQYVFLGINFWDDSFAGIMDDVAVYDRALSADDVAALYDQNGVPVSDKDDVEIPEDKEDNKPSTPDTDTPADVPSTPDNDKSDSDDSNADINNPSAGTDNPSVDTDNPSIDTSNPSVTPDNPDSDDNGNQNKPGNPDKPGNPSDEPDDKETVSGYKTETTEDDSVTSFSNILKAERDNIVSKTTFKGLEAAGLPADTKLVIKNILATDKSAKAATMLIDKSYNGKNHVFVDLSLDTFKGGQLKSKLEVTMPVFEKLKAATNVDVYRYDDVKDEFVKVASCEVKDGMITFETDHFTPYLFVDASKAATTPDNGKDTKTDTPKTGDSAPVAVFAGVGMAAFAVATVSRKKAVR